MDGGTLREVIGRLAAIAAIRTALNHFPTRRSPGSRPGPGPPGPVTTSPRHRAPRRAADGSDLRPAAG
ncbi:hypothetical protein [Saccharothrix longispora]|uniref:hypothetical protein n=1 Tax=Saccharothrix longispora TaxID=33920 RepID=UPI0028FD7959|nr:hypothetical protein [Saccharothrix longispora]MBY8847252.1 DUF1622 domain-containing protein [Saccharothrix sp. MB29]MDU0288961.1 hypothetical protein [Saccharothrix longispora]